MTRAPGVRVRGSRPSIDLAQNRSHFRGTRSRFARDFGARAMLMYLMQTYLNGYAGHPHQETLGWLEACRRREIEVKVFCDLSADASVVTEMSAVPAFGLLWSDVERFHEPNRYKTHAE